MYSSTWNITIFYEWNRGNRTNDVQMCITTFSAWPPSWHMAVPGLYLNHKIDDSSGNEEKMAIQNVTYTKSRMKGIEPGWPLWQAALYPLIQTCSCMPLYNVYFFNVYKNKQNEERSNLSVFSLANFNFRPLNRLRILLSLCTKPNRCESWAGLVK